MHNRLFSKIRPRPLCASVLRGPNYKRVSIGPREGRGLTRAASAVPDEVGHSPVSSVFVDVNRSHISETGGPDIADFFNVSNVMEPPQPMASEAHNIRNPMIEPIWWTGTQPLAEEEYTVDCSKYDMDPNQKSEALLAEMKQKYEATGMCLLTNTGLTDVSKMKEFASILMPGLSTYQGGANSRGAMEENVYDTGAPRQSHIHYHHEMAYVAKTVRNIAFCATEATEGKGYMYVSDSIKATEELLKTPFGQKLADKGVCYVRCLTDRNAFLGQAKGWNGLDEYGVYNHWQRSFMTETKDEVERLAAERGLLVDWGEDNYCKTRYYASAFEYFPKLDRNVLFSSLADDSIWFDTWPGVADLPTMGEYSEATPRERPLKLLFGDDTEFSREELQQFIDIYDKYGLPLRWKVGDIAIICNYTWAHGRPAYELNEGEGRTLGVMLGEPLERIGQIEGKF